MHWLNYVKKNGSNYFHSKTTWNLTKKYKEITSNTFNFEVERLK